jgi:hypothetical protein
VTVATKEPAVAEQNIDPEPGVLPGNQTGPVEPFAVVGEDGRRIVRHLPKQEAENYAAELSGRTGEKLKVKPDKPADE